MRVKIGNTWFDSNEQPICVQISEGEQNLIANLDREKAPNGKFAVYPTDQFDRDIVQKWMNDWMSEEDSTA